MADYTVRNIDDMYSTWLGGFKHARAELGVKSFGIQVIELPPNMDRYPEHDHEESGQEEVFLVLSGAATILIEGDTVPLEPGTMVRVGPATRRKLVTTDEPARILALGATPGEVYSPPATTELGAPDPLARN
jgi:mannose-6-phosphate isomerase-like protein (cupin superfamily)